MSSTPKASDSSEPVKEPKGLREPPGFLNLSALDEDFRRDPWSRLAEVREQEPGAFYNAELKGVLLFRAEQIEAVLRDRSLWMDPRKALPGTPSSRLTPTEDIEPSMLFQDDPAHKRLRGLVSAEFTPRALEKWQPRIRQTAEELLDRVEGRQQWDLIGDFAGPLPTIVIAFMLGLEEGDLSWFKTASDAVAMAFFNPLCSEQEREQGLYWGERLHQRFEQAIAERRENPGGDLVSSMVQAKTEDGQLTDQEIVTQCNLLLIAGNITTTDLIGNGVHALLRHPEQWRQLCQHPELAPNAVEELLRFAPPVLNTGRIASRDMEVAGCPLRRGENLSASLASANRDPRRVQDPDRLDVRRHKPQHQSFGGGAHFCLGAHLARLEAREALLALSARFADLQLAPEVLTQPDHRVMPGFHGFCSLPVRPGPSTPPQP